MEEYLAGTNLQVENVGRVPTFTARHTATCIDITLSINWTGVINWRVTDNETMSDHRLIAFETDVLYRKNNNSPGFNLSKCDWDKFRSLTETETDFVPPTSISCAWVVLKQNL